MTTNSFLKPRFNALKSFLVGFFVLTGVLLPVFFVGAVGEHFQLDTDGTLTTSLLSYYRMEDSNDFWGTNNLTAIGNSSVISGKVNNCFTFDGAGDYLTGGDVLDFEQDQPFSFSFWIKSTQFATVSLITKDQGSPNFTGYYSYVQSDGRPALVLQADATHLASVSTNSLTVNTGIWTHLILTYDGSGSHIGMKIYVNNVDDTYTSVDNLGEGTTLNSGSFEIASFFGGAIPDLDGEIDEVGVWGKILSAQERADLYNGGDGQTMISPAAGIEPLITAEKPVECAWNKETDWKFDFKGQIEIPTENPNLYNKFIIRLYNRQAMEMGIQMIDEELLEFPDLIAGQSWSWNIVDLPITPFGNGYSLTYWLEGYNLATLKPFRWALTPLEICGHQTILSNLSEFAVGLIPTEWITMIYEDCNLYEGIDKIICNFTNSIKGIFAPSQGALDGLNQDINQIQTKFPFTYILAFSNFIFNVKNGIDEDKGISFEILGSEGEVDPNFWEKTASVGGVVQSFSDIFKGFITLIVLIAFAGGWLIPFLRRIL